MENLPQSTYSLDSVEATATRLSEQNYFTDIGLSTSLYLALKMGKAIFLEGEPGVGKNEVATVFSRAIDAPLIRLQCYEGLILTRPSVSGITPNSSFQTPGRNRPGSLHQG